MRGAVIHFTHMNSLNPCQALFICPFTERKTEAPCGDEVTVGCVYVALGVY